MGTLILVIMGAMVGVRVRRRFASSPFSKFDHALIGGLAMLLSLTLLEMAEIFATDAMYGLAGIAILLLDLTLPLKSRRLDAGNGGNDSLIATLDSREKEEGIPAHERQAA